MDYLVWQIVKTNQIADPSRSNMFPICDTEQSFMGQLKGNRLQGVPQSAIDQITQLQPYVDPQNPYTEPTEYPRSSFLQDYSKGLENLLARTIKHIGICVYPNDHLKVRQVAESLGTIARRIRATSSTLISCTEIAQEVGIIQDYGGVEQNFPVDEFLLVDTPGRVDQVLNALKGQNKVIITAEPGAGKSWFIENLEKHLPGTPNWKTLLLYST